MLVCAINLDVNALVGVNCFSLLRLQLLAVFGGWAPLRLCWTCSCCCSGRFQSTHVQFYTFIHRGYKGNVTEINHTSAKAQQCPYIKNTLKFIRYRFLSGYQSSKHAGLFSSTKMFKKVEKNSWISSPLHNSMEISCVVFVLSC